MNQDLLYLILGALLLLPLVAFIAGHWWIKNDVEDSLQALFCVLLSCVTLSGFGFLMAGLVHGFYLGVTR